MSMVLMARQPIFTSDLDIVAYELLYRPPAHQAPGVFDGERATSSVLSRAFMDVDPASILGEHKAFVNFTTSLLLSGAARVLSSDRLVVEVLEDVVVDDRIVAAVQQLVDEGYTIALDDFVYSPMWDPLLEMAHIVKLDVLELGMHGVREQLALIERFDVELLAEKVETIEEYEQCRALGFRYFQGYFLCRPFPVVGNGLQVDKTSILSLLNEVYDPSATLDDIDALIRCDPTMSYRLLRLINSAALGRDNKVTSTRRALALLGLSRTRTLVSLVALSSVEQRPRMLVRSSLLRAKFCEELASAQRRTDADAHFVVGLFSNLHLLLDEPMSDLVARLPLSDDVALALTGGDSPLAEALSCAVAHERGEWQAVCFGGLDDSAIQVCWRRAVAWSDDVLKTL